MKKWATWICILGVVSLAAGCANQGQTVKTKQGAIAGGLLGAAAGGIIGHQKGRGLEGAAIGAAAGSVAGGVVGSAEDEKATQQRQQAPAY